jgi:probable HAF family extracellular repeat protein
MNICHPKPLFRILLLAGFFAAICGRTAEPPRFDLHDLGNVSPGLPSAAKVINNRGDIAGDFENANDFSRPFKYRHGTILLPGLPSRGLYTDGYVTDMNARGTVVGINRGEHDFDAAFICRHGAVRSLSNVLQYPIVIRITINDSGALAGTALLHDQGKYFAFRYEGGVRTVLPGLIPDGQTSVHNLNNAGVAVGSAEFRSPTNDFVHWHAAIFRNNTVEDLGALPGGVLSLGQDINEQGHAVGWSWTATQSATHAFLYKDGTMQDLGTLPGDEVSMASAINNRGEIVGHSVTHGGQFRAVLFADGIVYDLNGLLAKPTSLTLVQAYDINDRGQIVGVAWAGSYGRAVLLTPQRSNP